MSYGISSKGAEIATVDKFHYGTFEWSMRASSTSATADGIGTPVSGSITGCFVYLTGAQTEIDIEVEGNERNRTTQLTSWVGESNPNEHTDVSPISDSQLPHIGFHDYKFVWTPDEIEFYRDNVLIGTHTKVVPTEPANVMINHWGTNDKDWGGLATPDVTRYMWVKNFRYTPL
jgi:beta-glucanase (GH16 family)